MGAPVPASPPASPTKIQPSSQSWGSNAKLPGCSGGKTAGLPGSKSNKDPAVPQTKTAPDSPQPKKDSTPTQRQDSLPQTPPAKRPKVDNQNNEVKTKSSSTSTNKKGQATQAKVKTPNRPSTKTNPLRKARRPNNPNRLLNYLKTKAYHNKRQQVLKAYGLKPPRNRISEQKYLRAIQLQRKLYSRRKIQNNPLITPKTKLSNQDAVAGMPENPSYMKSAVRTLTNYLDKHPRADTFVAGIGNMASNTIALSISGIAAVAYTKGVWGPKEEAIKKTLEKSNEDQPYSLLKDPVTNTTYAVRPEDIPKDAVSQEKFKESEEDRRFQEEILARAAIPVSAEAEKRITDVLDHQDRVNKLWQEEHNRVEPTPSFVGHEENPILEQAIAASNYNPHAMKIKYNPMEYQEELEADSTEYLYNNKDKLSAQQKENIRVGENLGEQIYGLIKRHRDKHRPPPPSSDKTDLALLAGGGDSLWE